MKEKGAAGRFDAGTGDSPPLVEGRQCRQIAGGDSCIEFIPPPGVEKVYVVAAKGRCLTSICLPPRSRPLPSSSRLTKSPRKRNSMERAMRYSSRSLLKWIGPAKGY